MIRNFVKSLFTLTNFQLIIRKIMVYNTFQCTTTSSFINKIYVQLIDHIQLWCGDIIIVFKF